MGGGPGQGARPSEIRPGANPAEIRPGAIPPDTGARRIEDVRAQRREIEEGGRRIYQEPGRIIVRDRGRVFVRHDEAERFRQLFGREARVERRGSETVTTVRRPGNVEVVTVVDQDGRLLRRASRYPDGREVVIIDNRSAGPPRPIYEEVVELPPPPLRIPRDRYVVDAAAAPPELIRETLVAPPVEKVDRRYTLDQVRYSPDLRARMRSVDLDTITFDTGSWEVTPEQGRRLSAIAFAVNEAIARNPRELFLVEGYTDAVGSDLDNLSLSDRRAQSVAEVLTRDFKVLPENLVTQGYGEQNLKVNTTGPSRENRRVTLRRITPLVAADAGNAPE